MYQMPEQQESLAGLYLHEEFVQWNCVDDVQGYWYLISCERTNEAFKPWAYRQCGQEDHRATCGQAQSYASYQLALE